MTHKRRTPAWTKFTKAELAALPRSVGDTEIYGYYFGAECKHGHNVVRQRTSSGSQCMQCIVDRKDAKKVEDANPVKVEKPKSNFKTFKLFGMVIPKFTDHRAHNA